MEWFTTIEFYTLAITIAILLIGMIFTSPHHGEALTYVIQGEMYLSLDEGENAVSFTSQEDDCTLVCHHGITLPEGSELNMIVEIIGDKLTCVEKIAEPPRYSSFQRYDVVWRLNCLKSLKYHVRCECGYNDTWCTLTFLNKDGYTVQSEMKY